MPEVVGRTRHSGPRPLARRFGDGDAVPVILLPVAIALLWIAVARMRPSGRDAPLVPTTTVGGVALASVALVILVGLAHASLLAAVPAGIVMLVLAALARWVKGDRGLLLVLPFVSGCSVLVLPLLFE